MRFEVEEREVGDQTLKRVSVLPSDERGLFVVEHDCYRHRAVGSIGLAGMNTEDAGRLQDGTIRLSDLFISTETGQVTVADEGIRLVASVDPDGISYGLNVEISSFRELAAVPYTDR